MDLYLIRHADAVPVGEDGVTDDEQRPLSDKGEKQSKLLGRALKKRGIKFDLVLVSPLLRAQRTAELLIKASDQEKVRVETTSALTPNARPKKLSREMLKVGGERVALVGHMPHLGDLAAWIIGSKKAQIEFAKCGIAQITCGDSPIKGNGMLQWLVPPEWFD
jgi:phosphohistidine phosphatase